jgi:hypothetical protein
VSGVVMLARDEVNKMGAAIAYRSGQLTSLRIGSRDVQSSSAVGARATRAADGKMRC